MPATVRHIPLDVTACELDLTPLGSCSHLLIALAAGPEQDRRAVYVDGARRLLDETAQQRWERVVYVSSTSALPDLDGWIFEDCDEWPETERGSVQREAEDRIANRCITAGWPWLVIRLGGLYGPGRDLGALYRRRREGPFEGDGHTPTNLIHRDDAVASVLAALRAPAHRTGIVHVVDDDHTPRRDMYERLAQARDASPIDWESPRVPGKAPWGKRVSNHRMKSWLGVKLDYPTHSSTRAGLGSCERPPDG